MRPAVLLCALLATATASAHGFRPVRVDLAERDGAVRARVISSAQRAAPDLQLPGACALSRPWTESLDGQDRVREATFRCSTGLSGVRVAVRGLAGDTDALLRWSAGRGAAVTLAVRAEAPEVTLPLRPNDAAAALRSYVPLGFEHILTGWDHLLFVLGLLLLTTTASGASTSTSRSTRASTTTAATSSASCANCSAPPPRTAHEPETLSTAGGSCSRFNDPNDLSSCEHREEVMDLARALPAGAVDLIVGGHTHRGMAHVVNGVPVIQSFANGVALGRADFTVDLSTRRVQGVRVLAPRSLCAGQRGEPDASRCAPAPYEGATVTPDESVARAIAPAVARAEVIRARELGVTLPGGLDTRYDRESPLPNLLALSMRTAARADVGLQNHGGVRVDLPAGPLRYGSLYNTLPFDNRLVTIRLRGRALAEVIARNAGSDSGALAVSGVRAVVRCEGDRRVATLTRDDGRPVGDDEVLSVATNDYLASGSLRERAESPLSDDETLRAPTLRDAVIDVLRALGPTLSGEDPRWFEPARLRITLPGPRPVRCGG